MPNDFRQCKLCSKIYTYTGNTFCPNCVREVDKHFRTVKDFLYKNPNLTITEVVDQTGIDERIVLYFLREGRLEMSTAGDFLKCETCGASITTGRICSKCANGLSAVFDGVVAKQKLAAMTQKNPEPTTVRMHTTYSEKNRR